MFRWSDRGSPDAAPDDRALAARNAATQAFLALDDEQRATATAVDAADELGTARRLGDAWRQVAVLGDHATEAYLNATTDTPAGPATRTADERATTEIERAREAIRRFRSSHARVLDEAAHLVTGLPRSIHEARVALVDARAAVAGTAGVRSRRAEERLAEAELSAARLDSPGLRERRDAVARTLELAREAHTLAADAPRTAAQVRTALSSVTTRRAAAQTRTDRIPPALSSLRREFSEKCSRDLDDAERRAQASLVAADTAVTAARAQADAGDWDDAADQIAAARAELARAEERADAVTDRLAELRDVRADPARHAADARFVVRDAQRLVVDRGVVAEFGPVLDAQSVRLQNAVERLDGVHPDYWFHLTELRGVRERVQQVVERVRAAAGR
ncbi:hypothetical protein [Pseudonocardia abyssalis]|uniref:Molecular chaperone DnaJ n=1 Tax=Pseudonocardia abyssalis TaxID=2792008 RepID=A0ABS6UL86_9PSEU|nr:hypothetical protein [Pseudonocardia abyssalis]MBW0114626.1 hypothetical protein [Pseudonocardia abyssalis]MBW0132984.1 hypothetical protein [Pseudonocardia abyssalis]